MVQRVCLPKWPAKQALYIPGIHILTFADIFPYMSIVKSKNAKCSLLHELYQYGSRGHVHDITVVSGRAYSLSEALLHSSRIMPEWSVVVHILINLQK